MNVSIIIDNLLHPPALFFSLGMIASYCKSDIKIPEPLPKLFSLYLLFAIGFHGGVELNKTGVNHAVIMSLALRYSWRRLFRCIT